MKWNYDESIRDLFSQGPHRDILIVPHATYVTPVAGGPPEITSKVPQFEWRGIPVYDEKEKKFVIMQKPFPKKDLTTGEVIREDVEWVITNDDIVKEKFKYSHSLNSESNLTFSSCNAAMVQFTIRNKKKYVEELDDEGEPTGNYYWEQEIPNLQNYEFVEKDPNGNERKIVGELSGNACIKVYTYINGDSSTLMYLGMFNVDEDKAVDNGYSRQITAYDFLSFFRDCDIFYWYKHLWTGINKLDNDFEDYTNEDEKEKKKPDDYDADINWVRKPAKDLYPNRDGRWTIGEALQDLFNNFAAYDMITYDEEEVEVIDEETGQKETIKKTVSKLGNTVTNPNSYGRNYEEGNGYTGLGMPVMLDPDLFDNTKEYTIPTETGEDVFECYGYMDALDIEFYQDPNVMKSESLSMGKFLEDIGLLAGRYPYIRNDRLQDDDWFDPANCTGSENRYNNYEKCILTFKPLPTSKDDSKLPTDQMLDNTEISKGFSHESYTVDDIEIVKINFQDKSKIEYSRLTASQRKDKKTGNVQTFTFSDNLFVSYLVDKSDDEEIKKKLENYKALRNKIFGKENKKGNMSSKALFAQGYYNMKYRSYVPYELTTYADPVRDVGDRIKITYTDAVTGEHVSFFSYILEREMNGIQKCMDTYRAQGDGLNPIFSNYKTGSKYQSGSSYAASSFGYNAVYSGTGAGGSSGSSALGITPSDLVQYWRNFGIRLLDEPSDCQANFVKGASMEVGGEIIQYNKIQIDDPLHPGEGYVLDVYVDMGYFDNDRTINPINVFYYDYEHDDEKVYYDQPIEVHDFDLIEEHKRPDILYYDWVYCASWVYYQGVWYMVEDQTGYYYHQNDYWFVNVLAEENGGLENDDRVEEGTRSIYSVPVTYYDEEAKYIGEGVSTYDIITVNGNQITPQFGDGIYNVSSYEPVIYMPPGIWKYSNFCGTGGVDSITLGGDIKYHYLGRVDSMTEGSTQTTVTASNRGTVQVKEFDKVYSRGNSHMFIFFDGTWHDLDASVNTIINIYNESDLNNYPELKEIVYINSTFKMDALHGVNLDKITINGTARDIKIFDQIMVYVDGRPYYYVYSPSHVWVDDGRHPTDLNYRVGDTGNDNMWTLMDNDVPIKELTDATKKYVSLKWSDPQDITDWKPTPATWEGTVIVRKENSAPLHRWDGEKVVRTTTRDKYKTKAYKDEDIKANKVYYYGFFPYYTKISDPEHPIRFYTFTKSIRVETGVITYWNGDEIDIVWSGNNNKLTVQIQNEHIVFKIYIGNNVIYTFNSIIGSETTDISNINVGFLIDENSQKAKPSFIYRDADNNVEYKYNQEEPTDSEMQDIYTWLQPGIQPQPEPGWDGSEIDIVWSGNNNKMTVQVTNNTIVFKLYTANTEIYSFTSPVGNTKDDIDKINVGFIKDDNNQIAKPSLIYNNNGSYSYNQEEPTDAEMQDIYTWLSAGTNS